MGASERACSERGCADLLKLAHAARVRAGPHHDVRHGQRSVAAAAGVAPAERRDAAPRRVCRSVPGAGRREARRAPGPQVRPRPRHLPWHCPPPSRFSRRWASGRAGPGNAGVDARDSVCERRWVSI